MSYTCLLCGCEKDWEQVRFGCRCKQNHCICNECGGRMLYEEAEAHFPSGHYVFDTVSNASPFAIAVSLGKNVWDDWKEKCARAKALMPNDNDGQSLWLLVTRNMLLSAKMQQLGIVTKTDVKAKFSADIGPGRKKKIGFIPFNESLCYATRISVLICDQEKTEEKGGKEKEWEVEGEEKEAGERDLFCLELCAMDSVVESWRMRKGEKNNIDCCFKAFPPFNQMSFSFESQTFPFGGSYRVEIEITGMQIGTNNAALFITAGKCTDELFANDMTVSFPTNICYSNGVSAKLCPDIDERSTYKQCLQRKFRIDDLDSF